jgi:Raf kinase inhibitor-like YbhB/YbcL family protein
MDRHLNRRTLLATATVASGGILLTGAAAAQSTPVPSGTPGGGEGVFVRGRNPYEFLTDLPRFDVMSDDVVEGQEMDTPQRSGLFGAGGEDRSPHIQWDGQPEGVQSYVVTVYDPDAPTPSGFWHWAVMNIPGDATGLPSSASTPDGTALPEGAVELRNDAGVTHFVGAAPPPGPAHRYFIAVLALDVPELEVSSDATPALMSFMTLGHILAYGLLIATASSEA